MDLLTLQQQATNLKMDHVPFAFPIQAEGGQLVFSYNTIHTPALIDSEGMTLLLQHLGKWVNRQAARKLYREGEYWEFVNYINQARTYHEVAEPWRKDQVYIAAVMNGVVYGVCANYNPKYNEDVVRELRNSRLADYYVGGTLTTQEMNIYLRYQSQEKFDIGLCIRNGETGYATFGYHFYVRNHEYTFHTPLASVRRHLAKLPKAETDLETVYEELTDVKFYDIIMHTEAKAYADLLLNDSEFEKIHDLVQPYSSRLRMVYTLLGMLSVQATLRGYKTICEKALDKLYKELLNGKA